MAFTLEHLDAQTRRLMLAELDDDLAAGRAYLDPRLVDGAAAGYLGLLRAALGAGTPESFSEALAGRGFLRSQEERKLASGEVIRARVPYSAAQTIAEGEFNRYYMRAVCLLALQGGGTVEVYRAKAVKNPRPQEDTLHSATEMLEHLRTSNISIAGSFPGPNSGRSLRLPPSKR